jgi:hypothetical protein
VEHRFPDILFFVEIFSETSAAFHYCVNIKLSTHHATDKHLLIRLILVEHSRQVKCDVLELTDDQLAVVRNTRVRLPVHIVTDNLVVKHDWRTTVFDYLFPRLTHLRSIDIRGDSIFLAWMIENYRFPYIRQLDVATMHWNKANWYHDRSMLMAILGGSDNDDAMCPDWLQNTECTHDHVYDYATVLKLVRLVRDTLRTLILIIGETSPNEEDVRDCDQIIALPKLRQLVIHLRRNRNAQFMRELFVIPPHCVYDHS